MIKFRLMGSCGLKQSVRRYVAALMCVLSAVGVQSQNAPRLSIITCSPGREVYSLYGHTAIRYQYEGVDMVFNYGAFSFEQTGFMWRFILGECDYMLDAVDWKIFLEEYRRQGRGVTEQELNLPDDVARYLAVSLIENAQPANRVYRYNFLTNNCTTKVRDKIEEAVEKMGGKIEYPHLEEYSNGQGLTHRQMLHRFNCVDPWSMEGCDLLLAADVDTILSERATMCLPDFFMRYVEAAEIVGPDDMPNNRQPLVKETRVVIPEGMMPPLSNGLTPWGAAWILLGVMLVIVAVEYFWGRQLWGIDVVVLFLQGLVSLMLLFMMIFSAHPGVHRNWLVLLFHPGAFWGIYCVARAARRKQETRWHACNFAILVAFLVFSPWMPQDFGNIIVPLTLSLLTRPASYLLSYKKACGFASRKGTTEQKRRRKKE